MKNIKRIFLILFSAMLLSSAVWAAAKLPALSASKYIQTYTLNTGGRVYAYTDSTLKKQKTNCWISCASDECYIIKVSGNAVQVSYPLDKGGRSTQWFKRSDFTSSNLAGSLKYETFYKQVTTYRHFNGKVQYGYVGKNDRVYVLGTNGAYTQVIYPLTNGKWKMAWAKTSEVNAALKVPATPTPTPTRKPTPTPTPASLVTKYVVTSGSNLNVRERPNTSAKILGQLSNGSAVSVYSNYVNVSGWAKIKYNNKDGYVSAQYLSPNPPKAFNPVWPCSSSSAYQITCLYYYKDGSKHSTRYGYTYGMDITGGGNIRAVERGTVETAENLGSKSFGRYIVISHPNGSKSLYAHLSKFASGIKKGATVSKGQTIGVMGTTGNSSGIHLHFEMSNTDPWKTYYKDITNITFASNVRSNNNAKKNIDSNSKYIVNWIDKYYVYSGGVYRRK